MCSEALVLANPYYKFDEAIFDPERYIKLIRDDLIQVIKRSRKPELQASAALLKRLDTRDLYKCVGEILINKESKKKITAKDICSFSENGLLSPKDLIVHPYRLDWGLGEKYPLDHIHFFNPLKPKQTCELKRGDMT